MKAIELFKFVHDNALEYHWHFNIERETGYKNNVILFVDSPVIGEFMKLLKCGKMNDDGFPCIMKDGYICVWMEQICEYFGIDTDEVFPNGVIEGQDD